jgi:hypothetical protein
MIGEGFMSKTNKQIYSQLLDENEQLRKAIWRLYILDANEISLAQNIFCIETLVEFLNDDEQLFNLGGNLISDDLIVQLSTSPEMTVNLAIETMLDVIATVLDGREDTEEIPFRSWLQAVAKQLEYDDTGVHFDCFPSVATVAEIREAVREAREKLARKVADEETH